MNTNDVIHDPMFQELVRHHELAVRRLREDIIRLRAHYLELVKHPSEHSTSERWRGASLQEAVSESLDKVRSSADELVRYGFELAPYGTDAEHLDGVAASRAAHTKRLTERTGWGQKRIELRGPEEKIHVDGGPPITIVLKSPDPKQ